MALIKEYTVFCLDDVVIFSEEWNMHLHNLTGELKLFRETGLKSSETNSRALEQIQVSGTCSTEGCGALEEGEVKVLLNIYNNKNLTKKDVKAFLGLADNRAVNPIFQAVSVCLTDLTKATAPSVVQ